MAVQAYLPVNTAISEGVVVVNKDRGIEAGFERSSGAAVFVKHRYSRTTCSDIHYTVLEFRKAHNGYRGQYACADASTLQRYSLDRAPSEEHQAIVELSSPHVYRDIRRGGGVRPRYPGISDAVARAVCEEVRAAFVWKARVVRGMTP